MENKIYEKIESLIAPWKIEKELGEGAFGRVFKIGLTEFGNKYEAALKVITIPQKKSDVESIMSEGLSIDEATDYLKRFVEEVTSECALMSRFKGNSNIVSYEDHKVIEHTDSIGWDILIRMELLTPLLTYITNNPLSEEKIIQLGIDICKALELCKKHNVIHRDIKPENIFVSDDDKFKLGDFGIARVVEKTMGDMTKTGTITYMAPEVYKGEEYDYSVDIYSLGIVMYRFLNNNRAPFLSATSKSITYEDKENAKKRRIKGEIIPRPAKGCNELVDIVLKACSYNPQDRFSSPTQMREMLERVLYSKFYKNNAFVDYTASIKNEKTESFNDEPTQDMSFSGVAEKTEAIDEFTLSMGLEKTTEKTEAFETETTQAMTEDTEYKAKEETTAATDFEDIMEFNTLTQSDFEKTAADIPYNTPTQPQTEYKPYTNPKPSGYTAEPPTNNGKIKQENNKRLIRVSATLAIALVMFSIVIFAIPFEKGATFWMAYIAEVIAIGLQVPVFKLAYDSDTLESKVLGYPLFRVGYMYLGAQTAVSLILFILGTAFEDMPLWISLVLCVLILGIALICGIAVDTARDTIEKMQTEQEKVTRSIKKFRVDTSGFSAMTDDKELKKMLDKLADEFRYSDPVSSPELEEIEQKLQMQITALKNVLAGGDTASAKDLVNSILVNLEQRNRMCRLYK